MQTLWIALSLTSRVGSKTLRALFDHFGDDPQAILDADPKALQQIRGIGPKTAHSIHSVDIIAVEQALDQWANEGVSVTTFACPRAVYPSPLLAIDDPPPTLFMRGLWQPEYANAVAVVGTRSPSPLAEELALQIGQKLAQMSCTVVSGLAVGVDTLAHQGALSQPNGRSIAVLGSGVLNIYPEQNKTLAQQCERRGMILSEIAPDEPPNAPRLVARNRIISGLSQAVIVVETSDTGGAMHTARFAQDQGRPVYVVDFSASSGNQQLLENGAHPLPTDPSKFADYFTLPIKD